MGRWRTALWVVLLAWCGVVLFWATRPIEESVPTGLVNNQQTAQVVKCHSPLSGSAGPDGALPSLPDGRSFERTPCVRTHDEYRRLFGLDVIVALAGAGALVVLRTSGTRRGDAEVAAAA